MFGATTSQNEWCKERELGTSPTRQEDLQDGKKGPATEFVFMQIGYHNMDIVGYHFIDDGLA